MMLAPCRDEMGRGLQVQAMPDEAPEEMEPVLEQERRPARSRSLELARGRRRAEKLDRYEQVIELHQQGVKAADIASRIGLGERTVHRWLAHGSFPEARQRRRRPSLIDPYERYVISRWQEGSRLGSQLYRELTAEALQGFTQSHVQLSSDLTDTSIRLTQVASIETARAEKRSLTACTVGKLLCTAGHVAVCTSTR